jgi:hypothetical protein
LAADFTFVMLAHTSLLPLAAVVVVVLVLPPPPQPVRSDAMTSPVTIGMARVLRIAPPE